MSCEDDIDEKCSACGREFKEGDGRFRRADAVYCVDCYAGHDAHCLEYLKESETRRIQESAPST